jgi:hypothetical protein
VTTRSFGFNTSSTKRSSRVPGGVFYDSINSNTIKNAEINEINVMADNYYKNKVREIKHKKRNSDLIRKKVVI